MNFTVTPPKHPTHAVKHLDNHDGEGDIYTSLAFILHGEYYLFDTGEPILEYSGDEIFNVWELK